MSSQKDVFLASEGDAWFRRNEAALESYDWTQDPVCKRLAQLEINRSTRLLEIGCGDGSRLEHVAKTYGCDVAGIDPSPAAVEKALRRGVQARQGTADRLPFTDGAYDVVLFGFCLYLCDERDLFEIAREADRVLADPGWLLILDFDARAPLYKPYHHLEGIKSRKMDYKSMFLWHPAYTLAGYDKFAHSTRQWTDEPDQWVSVACLRRRHMV
jgi:ubiquinone/menaquinone biosynthesis C-methylase UbiE